MQFEIKRNFSFRNRNFEHDYVKSYAHTNFYDIHFNAQHWRFIFTFVGNFIPILETIVKPN